MPRAVFKLFWKTIQSDRPIAAYVQNLAADGSYYWVLAFAFPIEDGYLSIRLKPSSPLFEAARRIYGQVLTEEREKDPDAATTLLLSLLRQAGFESYEQFMVAATIAELGARDDAQIERESTLAESKRSGGGATDAIAAVSAAASASYRQAFARVVEFAAANKLIQEKSAYLLDCFHDLNFLSLNMSVLAAKIGNLAAPLGVIATEFSTLSAQIEKLMTGFSESAAALDQGISRCSLNLASLKIQNDVVDFFVRESLAKVESGSASIEQAFDGIRANRKAFLDLTTSSQVEASTELERFKQVLGVLQGSAAEIRRSTNGLEVIRQMAWAESARIDSIKQSFAAFINDMQKYIDILRSTSHEINGAFKSLSASVTLIDQVVAAASVNLASIFELAEGMGEKSPAFRDLQAGPMQADR
jgi:aerotaxis receptor